MAEKQNVYENAQLSFLEHDPAFPTTRYQGSKLKLAGWIWDIIKDLDFGTVLDAFGGTGSIGYLLKTKGKEVTYNDQLKFNWYIGSALIENDNILLSKADVDFVLNSHKEVKYPTFIQETFKDIYFTEEENKWLDTVVTNIELLDGIYKRALAYFALFQSCIIKRPYNLFHRKNLYMRMSDVERNFGNKVTWDTPFEVHFRKFVLEANQAVFSNGRKNTALNMDALQLENDDYDLVYIDTPYISKKGVGVEYFGFYHFLEGLVDYPVWDQMIDYATKNRRLKVRDSVWTDKRKIYSGFDQIFQKFKDNILVVSYRSDGIPTIEELVGLLKKYKSKVNVSKWESYKYVLSNNHSEEILLVGE
jgi:adenine-specific DNA-methyltransferase